MEKFENGYALLIGTGSDERIRKATVGDATGVQQVLLHNAQYPADQVRLLTNENATLEKIKEGFNWLAEQLEGLDGGEQKTAIVLYSGHGRNANTKVKEFFLEPYGMEKDGTGGLPASVFTRQVNRLLADRVVVILSCCHAAQLGVALGDGDETMEAESFMDETAAFVAQLEKGKGRVVISSSHASQESFAASIESESTIFGETLIEALKGKAARLSDEMVSALQVADYLLKNVEEKVKAIGRIQMPVLRIPYMESSVFLSRNEYYDPQIVKQLIANQDLEKEAAALSTAIEEKKASLQTLEKQMEQAGSLEEKYQLSNTYNQTKKVFAELTADQKYLQAISNIVIAGKKNIVKTLLQKRMFILEELEMGMNPVAYKMMLLQNTEKLERYGVKVDDLDSLDLSSIKAIIS